MEEKEKNFLGPWGGSQNCSGVLFYNMTEV
jgi:hypothetical protein